ncbi:MAG: FHA domain-containing protein [Nannocystaceae bacterium]
MALRLIIEDEEGATTIVPLSDEEITIGREAGNTIQLTEQNVSRQHARLTFGADGWMLEDLDSYNGIKVNNVSVEGQATLQEGDRVQIGDYHLTLVDNVDATALNLGKQAANDNGASASMRAAPSVDLPPLAPAAAAALAQPAANVSSPSATIADVDEPDEPAGGSGKAIILVLLLAAVGVGAYFAFAGGGPGKSKPAPSADTSAAKDPGKALPPETKQGDSGPSAKPPSTPVPAATATDTTSETTDAGTDDSAGETTGEPATGGEDPPEPVVKPKKKKKKVKKPVKPETPPEPAGDPAELLDKARKAAFSGSPGEAFRLAKESYGINRNSEALKLMGVSACKMGDEAKAKSVYKKVSASTKNQLSQLCKLKGIELEG